MLPPGYFDPIRHRAESRWLQLEEDPELAGPWHQLFKQVQSPRHVLSELLQNADDAGATEATVAIRDGVFSFTHNGEDFTEEHFASLCRFGYSNKRTLHTIGFRGIGFKSTFSLGDTIELHTPTLSVAFDRGRFTAPRWIGKSGIDSPATRIHVRISDTLRLLELEKNLEEWKSSPISLLFFKHLRRLTIGNASVGWRSQGKGPVSGSEWMVLEDDADTCYLRVQSELEDFPEDALSEIRQERLLGADQAMDLPPCRVEIVLGAGGRLYVVLPTGVETELPFACNAPFIQDPARLKIKDPEISPTNSWLLDRIGRLASSVMLSWLGDKQASLLDRARAYALYPVVDRTKNSLESSCATLVDEAFKESIRGSDLLLAFDGTLYPAQACVSIPSSLSQIWPIEQVAKIFDKARRPPLAAEVAVEDRDKLVRWGVLNQLDGFQVLDMLHSNHLPKPTSWGKLLNLWVFLAPIISRFGYGLKREEIRIFPVQGKDVLYAASEIVRLGEKKLLQSEDDWGFLANHLLVLNQNWVRYLAKQRRVAAEEQDYLLGEEVEAAYSLIKSMGLEEPSDASEMIEQVAKKIFNFEKNLDANCVQIAQIAAKLGASVGGAFRYATRDNVLKGKADVVLFDPDGTLETLFDSAWCDEHFLNAIYEKDFRSCTADEWKSWQASDRSGLFRFPPLLNIQTEIYSRQILKSELTYRNSTATTYFPYVTNHFRIDDWDFDAELWKHWRTECSENPSLWGQIVERILGQPEAYSTKVRSSRALQVATTGSTRSVTSDPLLPSWILKLRELPCLRDTRGFYHLPGDLLRRTPETESLMDVEPFVYGLLDSEATRPLLDLLGVRSTPSGPERLLDRLRALAKTNNPPTHEVEKWYRRLDQLADTCTTADLTTILDAFASERILLTEEGEWNLAAGVFITSDEDDIPGAALIRSGVRGLMLWRKIGIAERPTANLAIKWLSSLPSSQPLRPEDMRRVRAILARHPDRVWNECGHWINLAGEWVPIGVLSYSMTMQSLVAYKHLHHWVKQKTADFQQLSVELTDSPHFAALPTLAAHIEDRLHQTVHSTLSARRQPWLTRLGTELRRVNLDDDSKTARIKKLASDLAVTTWQVVSGLESIPYIAGTPAGTPRKTDALWLDNILFVEDRPPARLAKALTQELSRAFRMQEIGDAIMVCYDRPEEYVSEYMEENFTLAPPEAAPVVHADAGSPTEENSVTSLITRDNFSTDDEKGSVPANIQICMVAMDPIGQQDDTTADEPAISPESEPKDSGFVMPKPKHHLAKPSLIERFARSLGFKEDGEQRFYHADGSWLAKTKGTLFPWERRNATGNLLRYYLPKEHCLDKEPLQLDADVWGSLDHSPGEYALILCDTEGRPIEVSGGQLGFMRDEGKIKIFPASYRLVLE